MAGKESRLKALRDSFQYSLDGYKFIHEKRLLQRAQED